MDPKNTIIVSSIYKTPIPWADRLREMGFEVHPYTKEDPTSPYNVPKNIGNEASAYLKYIIDNYESLPEYSILLHDHEYSYHQEGSIIDAITSQIGTKKLFWNFNKVAGAEFYLYHQYNPDGTISFYNGLVSLYNEFLEPYCGELCQYGEFIFGQKLYAQFLVHKSLILARPKIMYENIYNWMMIKEKLNRFISGFFLEVFWELIFGQVQPQTLWPKVAAVTFGDKKDEPIAVYTKRVIDFFYVKRAEELPNLANYQILIYYDNSIKEIHFDHIYSQLKYYNLLDNNFTLTLAGDISGAKFKVCSIRGPGQEIVMNDTDIYNSPFLGNSIINYENRFKLHYIDDE